MKNIRKLPAAKNRSFEERLAQRLRSRKLSDAKLRARQAQGKIRRFVNTNFRKTETVASLSLRRGECNRCGACCELVFKCPFLKKNSDGSSTCGIYENRPNSCRLFPIEPRDIREVRGTCSYYFIERPIRLGKAS
jgi:Putative zinc- or iron-chelating domain